MCCAQFVKEQNLPYYYDVGTDRYKGVCHIALPEEGHTRPGEVLLGTDSHTCTAGAFGEFATGIGNTDAGFVMGTGKLWLKTPPTMRFVFHGNLPPYLMAKDLILAVIGDIGCDGATYRAMEFDGDGVFALNIEERMTLCNMVIEAGGQERRHRAGPGDVRLREQAEHGQEAVHRGLHRPGAKFVFEKVYDVTKMEPVIAKPHSPDNKAIVTEVKGTKLDRAYIGSCTGGKLTDFKAAAELMNGKSGEDRHVRGPGDDRSRARAGHREDRRQVAAEHLPRGRREDRRRELCRVPGRAERHLRPAEHADLVHQHDEPQLPRPDGAQGGEGLPRLAADRGRQRPGRHHRGLPRAAGMMESNRTGGLQMSITITDPTLLAQFDGGVRSSRCPRPDGRVIGTFFLDGYGVPPTRREVADLRRGVRGGSEKPDRR